MQPIRAPYRNVYITRRNSQVRKMLRPSRTLPCPFRFPEPFDYLLPEGGVASRVPRARRGSKSARGHCRLG